MDVVVRGDQRAVGGGRQCLARRRRPLDGDDDIAVSDDQVVRGGASGVEDGLDGVGQRAPRQHVAHLEEARDADALVLGRDLVPGHREPGVGPAHADPGADAEREDRRLVLDPPLDRDHVLLFAGSEIVGVADEEVAAMSVQPVGAASRTDAVWISSTEAAKSRSGSISAACAAASSSSTTHGRYLTAGARNRRTRSGSYSRASTRRWIASRVAAPTAAPACA